MGRFLDRYRQGEQKQVWDELLAQGEAVRQEPLLTDVSAVVRETMQRVRHNIEVLIPRLRTFGYQFGEFWGQDPLPPWRQPASSSEESDTFLPFVPPHPETPRYLEQLEHVVGPLPLSLRAFYLEVGGVNLLGSHPLWDPLIALEKLDPLYVYPLTAEELGYALEEYADYQSRPEAWGATPFTLHLAPDSYHKYNISGGSPYSMAVPDARIDGLLLHEWHNTTFIDYLRSCFRAGGLPLRVEGGVSDFSLLPLGDWAERYHSFLLRHGWKENDLPLAEYAREWGQKSKELTEAVASLRQDLLPI